MVTYYNEIDPFAVAWLRELIKAKLIAPGEVDERSIEEVEAADLRGFTQCHFFAGVGVWSYALRNAGWRDDEPVWTGSCPCPPFSSAGKQKACPRCNGTNPVPHVGRTGYFVCCLCDHEWFADARHLWPELWRLIRDGHPDRFFGEQVASNDGRTWLASVRASLEILGYAVGAADICSAGVGAADIRQRLYFVANAQAAEVWTRSRKVQKGTGQNAANGLRNGGTDVELGNPDRRRLSMCGQAEEPRTLLSKQISGMGHARSARLEGREQRCAHQACGVGPESHGPTSESSSPPVGTVADPDRLESNGRELQRGGRLLQLAENPLNGFWSDAEWIYCRDGKYRAVEPGTFPLAHGAPARVGRLRGYGNAVNAEVAKTFIQAYLEVRADG